jgi:deazaflavin-dependent oxidoreductase (nitroreductase family)
VTLERSLARRSFCYVETTGRVTGQPREIEMWFAADPDRDRIYLLSGGRDHADWVRNMRKDPRVRVRIGDQQFTGEASEVEDGPDEPLARRLLAAKYQDWREGRRLSSWARTSLSVAIDLDRPAT